VTTGLRSATHHNLHIPQTKTKTFGPRVLGLSGAILVQLFTEWTENYCKLHPASLKLEIEDQFACIGIVSDSPLHLPLTTPQIITVDNNIHDERRINYILTRIGSTNIKVNRPKSYIETARMQWESSPRKISWRLDLSHSRYMELYSREYIEVHGLEKIQ